MKQFNLLCLLAIISLVVVGFGYYKNKEKNYQQRVHSARVALPNEIQRLQTIQNESNQLFTDATDDLFNPGVNSQQVEQLRNTVDSLKVSAADYQIKATDLKEATTDLQKQKQDLVNRIETALTKVRIQEKISLLFQEGTTNWQGLNDQVVIQLSDQMSDIEKLNHQVSQITPGNWQNLANAYLAMATDQLNQSTPSIQILNQLMVDNQLTPTADATQYQQLLDSLNTISNGNLLNLLSLQAQNVAAQLQANGKL